MVRSTNGRHGRAKTKSQRRRNVITAAVIMVTLVALTIAIVMAFNAIRSNSNSGAQQITSMQTQSVEQPNGTWITLYILHLANGTKRSVPESVYEQSQNGGGYNPTTHAVLSPEEETQQQEQDDPPNHYNVQPAEPKVPADPDPDPVQVHPAPPEEPIEIPHEG